MAFCTTLCARALSLKTIAQCDTYLLFISNGMVLVLTTLLKPRSIETTCQFTMLLKIEFLNALFLGDLGNILGGLFVLHPWLLGRAFEHNPISRSTPSFSVQSSFGRV